MTEKIRDGKRTFIVQCDPTDGWRYGFYLEGRITPSAEKPAAQPEAQPEPEAQPRIIWLRERYGTREECIERGVKKHLLGERMMNQ